MFAATICRHRSNPRHVGYYRRSLGFEILGEERHNLRVNAPAVLMGMSFRKIGENMHRYAGKETRATRASAGATRMGVTKAAMQRSFYVYGFSPAEEAGILVRLRRIDRQSARRANPTRVSNSGIALTLRRQD
jgi:hypothetical protein